MSQPPQNAAEEAENALRIAVRERKPAQQQVQIAAIGLLHRGGRVVGGLHGFRDDFGKQFEIARRSGSRVVRRVIRTLPNTFSGR